MLKALELTGFKSFADKTRFEFPPGITVVVGPNGSGKSNIVDAIKWVLGEQSAKSLRGRDMSDVIFKGSGQSGRKVMNTAEATIVFENADRRLPIDAPEVHVTRRVYRSGEGEYLINRQPCRLKDVRDLFRGTGVGTDAYSLIEQGKVDQLLQASPRDRRAIFEEAAGISRFKAKKVEAQRRLERVEQNLLRLSDIVEEVSSRLRGIRSQASKARRYREYSDRLQQLRTHIALTDWRALTERLSGCEEALARLADQIDRMSAEWTADEARGLELETDLILVAEATREREHQCARNREQIASRESMVERERQHLRELEEETGRCRQRLAKLTGRAGDVAQRVLAMRDALRAAEEEHGRVVERLAERDAAVAELTTRLKQGRAEGEENRAASFECVRRAAQLTSELALYDAQCGAAEAAGVRCTQRLERLREQEARQTRQLEATLVHEQELAGALDETAARLAEAERELAEADRLLSRRRDELAVQNGRLSGITERAALLEELERRNEGLTAGVRQVLELARGEQPGPFAEVRGLVADVIQVPMQWAPLVDAALGVAAQHVVLQGHAVLNEIRSGTIRLAGRVGLISLEDLQPPPDEGPDRWDAFPGVLGRLDRLVTCAAEFRPLASHLLGSSWAVEMLHHGCTLRANGVRHVRFITLEGELVEADGTIVVGPKDVAGLISRRTELRDLRREQAVLTGQVGEGQQEVLRLHENIERQRAAVRRWNDDHRQ
ncbi:MAG: chromosome segregation protein SMC, partial [Planctomycetes bacterium]|nr:chromosome segregation protein SMC [Planctomycetota bacterium]